MLHAHKIAIEAANQVTVTPIAMDLAESGAAFSLAQEIAGRGMMVDLLVNNAGFGASGPFVEMDRQTVLDMVALNITALSELTHELLPGMIARGRGRILNVASLAAFLPGPYMAVYYATKAYVLSFSEALSEETRGTGRDRHCILSRANRHRLSGPRQHRGQPPVQPPVPRHGGAGCGACRPGRGRCRPKGVCAG